MSSDGHASSHDHKVIKTEDSGDDISKLSDYEPTSYQPPSEGSEYVTDDRDSDALSTDHPSDNASEQLQPGLGKPSRKRKPAIEEEPDSRPKKRAAGSINRAYLNLLNEDIMHAASQYVPLAHHQDDQRIDLPVSQIGMTVWSAMEKERFFEALGRLGRDDAPGIARRVRTKGEMEVRQYMKLLQDSIAQRQQFDELPPLVMSDFPAAVELSHECCQALEAVADHLAARQDHFETTVEQGKYGAGWLVSKETAREGTKNETEGDALDTNDIFNIPNWLMLSERFFMNTPSKEGNWQAVHGDTPSVRLSTLNDFRSLALVLTRRLVAASLYTATSRVRAERGSRLYIEDSVKDKDVHAAAVSLGMSTQKPALLKSIQRLGLQVYEEPPKPSEEGGREPLSYEAIEDGLTDTGVQRSVSRVRRQIERIGLQSDENSISSDSTAESGTDTEAELSSGSQSDEAGDEEDEDVVAEANEAILYSALDPPQTKRDRQVLFRRIKAERAQEAHAEAVDAQATYQEEKRLWEMLEERPLEALSEPGTPATRRRLSTKQSVEAGYVVGKDWRTQTRMISEWESQYSGP